MEIVVLILLVVNLIAVLMLLLKKQQNIELPDFSKDIMDLKIFIGDRNNDLAEKMTLGLNSFKENIAENLADSRLKLSQSLAENADKQNKEFVVLRDKIAENLERFEKKSSEKQDKSLKDSSELISKQMEKLSQMVDKKLAEISEKVEEKLSKGFEKTNQTFIDITKRLTRIDEAQKKIETLSQNVVSLQDVLSDKKSRGIFGEVQLNHILSSVFGENNKNIYSIQQKMESNGNLVDAMIYLPEPLGKLPVDSKFPLENYRVMIDNAVEQSVRDQAEKLFKGDVKKHIADISSKYIIAGETEQAIMFLPAEAVFAELNAYHSDILDYGREKSVWIVSPSTFMAFLTTIQSVLRNIETQKQAKVIQEELSKLSKDFGLYKKRWDNLSKHIDTVSKDVKEITITTNKISNRFTKIERVELDDLEDASEVLEDSSPQLSLL